MRLPDVQLAVPETELHVTASLVSGRLDNLPARFTPRRPGREGEATAAATPAAARAASLGQPLPAAEPTAEPSYVSAGTVPRGPWWRRLIGRRS
jgi:hypothetical protein